MAVDIFEYVDPKGRKPVAYTKIMKKYKINEEQVLLEASKLNLTIDAKHFEIQEEVVKRGRPAAEKKEAKEPKGAKGRPKKEKKVLAIEGEGEHLFANLVANAQEGEDTFISNKVVGLTKEEVIEKNLPANAEDDDDDMSHHTVKIDDEEEDVFEVSEKVLAKEQEKALKAREKALAAQVKEQEKALKAQEKAQAVQAKEQKTIADKIAKEQKLALAAKAKEEKFGPLRAAAEKEKKLALVAAKKEPKVATKNVVEDDDEEPDVVKKIEVDGKKYLKSKKSGIIYDYIEYTKNSEQVVVGKWNETKNKIDFTKVAESDEESEDEIEDDEA
jgi:hypothetical protein